MLGPNHPDTAWSLCAFKYADARGDRRSLAVDPLSHALAQGLPTIEDIGIAEDADLKPMYGGPKVIALLAKPKLQSARK